MRHEIQRHAKVLHLTRAFIEASGAAADAAKIESQHRAPCARQSLRALKDRFGVHRAAVRRERMGKDDGGLRRAGRLIEQRLEAAGRSFQIMN